MEHILRTLKSLMYYVIINTGGWITWDTTDFWRKFIEANSDNLYDPSFHIGIAVGVMLLIINGDKVYKIIKRWIYGKDV